MSGGQSVAQFFKRIWYVITLTGKWIYFLRSIFLAIPVAVVALGLAMRNMRLLPESVGINILANGEYEWMISRNLAVLGPLVVTGVCLLLTLCSRKMLYPWLISIFTLVLPLVIWVTNLPLA